jgi:hypothetical protein
MDGDTKKMDHPLRFSISPGNIARMKNEKTRCQKYNSYKIYKSVTRTLTDLRFIFFMGGGNNV